MIGEIYGRGLPITRYTSDPSDVPLVRGKLDVPTDSEVLRVDSKDPRPTTHVSSDHRFKYASVYVHVFSLIWVRTILTHSNYKTPPRDPLPRMLCLYDMLRLHDAVLYSLETARYLRLNASSANSGDLLTILSVSKILLNSGTRYHYSHHLRWSGFNRFENLWSCARKLVKTF